MTEPTSYSDTPEYRAVLEAAKDYAIKAADFLLVSLPPTVELEAALTAAMQMAERLGQLEMLRQMADKLDEVAQ